MARKRNKKAEVEEPKQTTDTQTRKMQIIDMDKKLEEVAPTSGLTAYQQYMRDKIKNASKKA